MVYSKPPVVQAQINNTAETVMFMDCRSGFGVYARPSDVFLPAGKTGVIEAGHTNYVPHLDGYNITFADGHVKWFGQNNPIGLNENVNKYWNDIAP